MMERKIEEINGISYTFHISTEQKGIFINGYIQLLNNQESFREIENPGLTLKRILYYHIFQKMDKYLIIKTADVETDEEFKGLYEIIEIEKITDKVFNETIQVDDNEEITFKLKILNDFKDCKIIVPNPFGNSRTLLESNTQQIMNLFRILVFYVEVSSNKPSRISFTNEIENFIHDFVKTQFGNAFLLMETERIACSINEVQIKYVIMPNGF